MARQHTVMTQQEELCKHCKLYQNGCSSPGLGLSLGTDTLPKKLDILVVTKFPGKVEDRVGWVMSWADFDKEVGPGMEIMRAWREALDHSLVWGYVPAVRCYPGHDGNRTKRPSGKQQQLCATYLMDDIVRYRPKIIIALGAEAMKACLGNAAPRSLGSAIGAPIITKFANQKGDEYEAPVVVTYHPDAHVSMRMDLSEEYQRVFGMVEKIALGTYCEPEVWWEETTSKELAKRLKKDKPKFVCFDWEDGQHKHNPNARTVFHPDATPLLVSYSWFPGSIKKPQEFGIEEFCNTVTTQVVDVRDCRPDTLENLKYLPTVYNKDFSLIAHHLKFDAQCHWRFCRRDNLFERVGGWIDTLLIHYLQDQGKTGNALKAIVPRLLSISPWDTPIKELMKTIESKWVDTLREIKKGKKTIPRPRPWDWNEWTVTAQQKFLQRIQDPPQPDYRNLSYDKDNWEELMEYNAKDTTFTLWLFYHLMFNTDWGKQLQERPIYQLIHECIPALAKIEQNGLPMDRTQLKKLRIVYQKKADEIVKTMRKTREVKIAEAEYGKEFNSRANGFLTALAQVTGVIDQLDKSKKTGQPSFPKAKLKELAGLDLHDSEVTRVHKLWRGVHFHRSHLNYISKFIDVYDRFVLDDNRLHTTFSMAKVQVVGRAGGGDFSGGTTSGRWGSQDPPLHLLTGKGLLRTACVAPPGMSFIASDLSTVEPIVNAHVSKCKAWLDIFRRKKEDPKDPLGDIYKITYGQALGMNPEKIVDDLRDAAKIFLLAATYDRHPATIAKLMGWSLEDSVKFCNRFWDAFPEIAMRSNRDKATAAQCLPVITEFGRQQYFPLDGYEIDTSVITGCDPMYVWADKLDLPMNVLEVMRTVGNFRIQSVGSDLTNTAMVELYKLDEWNGGKVQMIHTIHDALVFLVSDEIVKPFAKHLCRVMTEVPREAIDLKCPLISEVQAGKTLMKKDMKVVYAG